MSDSVYIMSDSVPCRPAYNTTHHINIIMQEHGSIMHQLHLN